MHELGSSKSNIISQWSRINKLELIVCLSGAAVMVVVGTADAQHMRQTLPFLLNQFIDTASISVRYNDERGT